MSKQPQELEQFLEALQLQVNAFGICAIGRQFRLRCIPFETVVVHFVLKGAGFFECTHGRFPVSKGTIIIVPKQQAKSLCGIGPIEFEVDALPSCTAAEGLVSFAAHAGEPDLVLACAELSRSIAGSIPLFDQAKRPIIEKGEGAILTALFSMIETELENPGLGTRAFLSALMKQVLIVVLRSQPDHDSSILLRSGVQLAGAVAAILERPEAPHTIASLATISGMSRSRFCDHFAVAYDCTPRAFVQTARLSAAARMLRDLSLPVKTIAAKAGYSSRSHFSRLFQAEFGLDPTEFRTKISND